ncbi:hypothetical protein DSM25559_4973 [Agrobacterium rosae]|uniref:Uncharacterized protein n=1 Tax=Agrobacterium rosae TaxID=1972867 RepID=A0A1R3U2C7_9HYPH|nr:hypothetical protein DSM25559_4973 [Agrobacterium rosae]
MTGTTNDVGETPCHDIGSVEDAPRSLLGGYVYGCLVVDHRA